MRFIRTEHRQMGIHTLVTEKFKTTTLVLNIQRPLTPEAVTTTALIPHLLSRGSLRYPTVRDMQRQLDVMYGSYLSADAFKLGERHILQVRVEIPNGKYLPTQPKLLAEGLAFLYEVTANPLRENGRFKPAFVELEKEALRKRIEGLFNHKSQYAMVRAIETLCPNEPYRLYAGGRSEDLAGLTPETLTAAFDELLATAPMDLFIVGDVDPAEVEREVARIFQWPTRTPQPLGATTIAVGEGPVKHVFDEQDVSQGQLVLGLRTPVHYGSDDHYAMMLYNGILGGFAHSKLFVNVRERESLAYSASSRYESHKGLLFITAGINIADYDKALAVIHEQLDAMAAGSITDTELQQTRAMILNTYREANDSPGAQIKLAYESQLAGRERSLEDLVAAMEKLDRDDVVRVAKQIRLDTVYFLRDRAAIAAPTEAGV